MNNDPFTSSLPGGRVTEEERAAARRTIAAFATSVEDARDLMAMCGLLPGQEDDREPGYCRVCGGEIPLTALSPKFGVAEGVCGRACAAKRNAR